MKRVIRYLYEYEQGKRMRNVGFVKVEQGEDECILNIHGKGLRLSGGSRLQIYLIYEDNGKCVGVWQREAENINPALNETLRYTREETGSPENFEKIDGVLLEHEDGRRYAAVWDETPMDVSGMRKWMPEEPEKETDARQSSMPEEAEERPEEEVRERPEMPEPSADAGELLSGEEEEAQIPLIRSEDAVFGQETEEQESEAMVWNSAKAERPVSTWRVKKIQRSELSKLARCEWRLANNNFLLHGYYNYHHLVLLEKGERLMLGVPGIYHEKEAAAAGAFGFAEFIARDSLEIRLTPEECNEEQLFGYWCRPVRSSFKWE